MHYLYCYTSYEQKAIYNLDTSRSFDEVVSTSPHLSLLSNSACWFSSKTVAIALIYRLFQNLMSLPPFTPNLYFHTLEHPLLQILIPYIHSPKSAMSGIKIERPNGLPNLVYLVRRERNHIRY